MKKLQATQLRWVALWALAAIGAGAVQAAERDTFSVGSVSAQPGSRASGSLSISAGSDAATEIPVTVVHGAAEGPVLALIAGTHGYEYAPITALQRVRGEIDPTIVSGTIIMVHIANPASFYKRTIYFNPVDGKNLNRVYPGDPAGTQSERIAHQLTQNVIEVSDFVIDLHGGDGNEALRPFIYMPKTGDAALDEGTRNLAIAFGLDHIVIDESPLRDPDDSLYVDQTALTRGIPAVTTETGQLGSNAEEWVSMAERGIWNVLRSLDMLPGAPDPVGEPVWLTDYEVVVSPAQGIFQPAVRDGYVVARGGQLGTIVDAFGDEITTVTAPFAGVVNYIVATPPISEGEPVAMLSRIGSEASD